MIEYVQGNLLDAPAGSIIIHGCNCQGVMGSGVAKAIRDRWPGAYEAYKAHERDWGLWLGEFSLYETDTGCLVVNAYTQDEFGKDGRRYVDYEAITRSFDAVAKIRVSQALGGKEYGTVAFPKIGAGLGGGNWEIISTIIDQTVPSHIRKVCYSI